MSMALDRQQGRRMLRRAERAVVRLVNAFNPYG